MKQCKQCLEWKPITEFYTKINKIGGKKYTSCFCKICDKERTRINMRIVRKQMIIYAGGKCIKCGYDKCTASLDFHHRDKNEKEFKLNTTRSFSGKIKKEIDKCDLLCANCHRELHHLEDSATNRQNLN